MSPSEEDSLCTGDFLSPITLPCGRTLRNRMVKVSMYEHTASFWGGPPNDFHYSLYSKWATGDWAMIFTGNVQVSATHLSLGRDILIPEAITEDALPPFRRLASCMRGENYVDDPDRDIRAELPNPSSDSKPLAIMQLSHGGRQSVNVIGGRRAFEPPLGPSAVSVGAAGDKGCLSRLLYKALFQCPNPMVNEDINLVVKQYVRGAKLAYDAGFDGIELHAAHGYLLAQFMSTKANHREDDYSVSTVENTLRLLQRIVMAIRDEVADPQFVLGVKLNAGDYVAQSEDDQTLPAEGSADRAVEHAQAIAEWDQVDFIEISGGDYENVAFMDAPSDARPRQALFSQFAKTARQRIRHLRSSARDPPLILLTGGFRRPLQLNSALEEGHADLLGFGRFSVLCPHLPRDLAASVNASSSPATNDAPFAESPDLRIQPFFKRWLPRVPLLGTGAEVAWYTIAMRHLALSVDDAKGLADFKMSGTMAVWRMWFWRAPRRESA